jgi:hypothetical protein
MFERTPELLHGTDPAFTPSFPGSVCKFLKPDSLFHRQDGEIVAFIARRDGRPVGRVAAILNRPHNQHTGDKTGFFGFFACENDPCTANLLIKKACDHLRALGCDQVRGPYNPTIHDDCGVMVAGNEKPASISMPWNPAYYGALLEAAGFSVERILFAYHMDLTVDVPQRVQRIAKRIRDRTPDITIRSFRMDDLDNELRLAHRLYNVTLDRNSGFYPITVDDLLASADDLKAFANPEFLTFAEVNGEAIGFMLTLPNFNEILHRTRNIPYWLRIPWIFYLMKTLQIRAVRQAVLGVAPEHRDRGLAALMCYDMVLRTREQQATSAELSWIETNNKDVIGVIEAMGGVWSKTYHLYHRVL